MSHVNIDKMSISKLKQYAKEHRIPGYSLYNRGTIDELRALVDSKGVVKPKSIFETPFEDLKITTKTIVVSVNIDIFTENAFSIFPVAQVEVPPSIRSKKKIKSFIAEHEFADGTILGMEYEFQNRGIHIKHFRNAMSGIMNIQNKMIHFKIPDTGKIHLTGCANEKYAEMFIERLWTLLQEYHTPETPLFSCKEPELKTVFRVAMTNRNFNLGFIINREALDRYVNLNHTRGRSFAEETFGYAGVNIKFSVKHKDIKFKMRTYSPLIGWTDGFISYTDFLDTLSPKEYRDEVSKNRRNTFMVFRSGSVIMSGIDTEHMRDEFYRFIELIKKCRSKIEVIRH